ncbi:MAG: hypothetical protein NWF01_06230 [Candidatus Bathyarchaeota archaeon]|nr:hypothetical protein [Candidatus Bathyarchaeota archaeon]
MDEVLEMLTKMTKRVQKTADDSKEAVSKQAPVYDKVLQSAQSTQEQKTCAFIAKTLDLYRLERLNSQLSLLYALQIFAFKVKVLDISVDNISEQLAKSGALEKTAEIEHIKKNIDALKILIEAHYKSTKEIHDNQTNLSYIH